MASYCQGCRDFDEGIGGENQMSHYGGCIPFQDFHQVPGIKRRKTNGDELEKKGYQLKYFKEEIKKLEIKVFNISEAQRNYIEKIKELEDLESKIKELSLLADRLEIEMSELEKEL